MPIADCAKGKIAKLQKLLNREYEISPISHFPFPIPQSAFRIPQFSFAFPISISAIRNSQSAILIAIL
jgi:hypothetical protein